MPTPENEPNDGLSRELGHTDTTMLVVSSVIGVGIFLTPGVVAAELPSPTWFLLAWIAGGLLSLAGALANAELGAMFPRAGGDYVYIREAYHPTPAFFVGWLSFFVVYAGTVATLAIGAAEGIEPFVPLGANTKLIVAIVATWAVSWVNYRGVRAGARVNTATAVAKLATMTVFCAVVWFFAEPSEPATYAPVHDRSPLFAFGLALSPVLFTFLGWNAPIYVASEIRDPGRNIPTALFVGLGLCTAVYVLINAVYLHVLPMTTLAETTRVGEAVAVAVFGSIGGKIAAGLILLSIVGCLNATVLVGPRIAYAMALDGFFFPGAERVHPQNRTPHIAIFVQAAVASGLILLLQSFPSVLDYTTFAIVLATMANTCALYVLRWNAPDMPRPYLAWGYPWVPAFYLIANGAIAIAMIAGRPMECLAALAVTATGVPFLLLFSRRPRIAPPAS